MTVVAQCFGCVDALSYQYHGKDYDAVKTAERYTEAYQEEGQPVIECVTCGAHVKYDKQDNGRWLQVFVAREGA